ncbi:MAG: hypothetical protein ACRDHG_06035, partial [Anaerolineales bacterium]
VVDTGPSSGIKWVQLKYKILGPGSKDYQFSGDIGPPISGDWTDGEGSSWDAYYKGDLTISFSDGYAFRTGGKLFFRPSLGRPSAVLTGDPFTVEVWSIVEDNAGNQSFMLHGTYTLDGSCGG